MSRNITLSKDSPNLLNRILDQPGVVEMVQNLDAGVLTRLIRHIGLEDSAEIVAMATSDQLRQVFDEDLWFSAAPGLDETFDADRFILWLEVMLENGPAFAAHKISQLDEDMVTLALSRQLLVLDVDAIAGRMAAGQRDYGEDLLDKTLDSCTCLEIDQYLLIARKQLGWDAITTLLMELNECNYPLLGRLLERCTLVSTEFIEDNDGLFNVLTMAEMLASDLDGERESRRQAGGFVTPTSAAAFLARLRSRSPKAVAGLTEWDSETRKYFKVLQRSVPEAGGAARHASSPLTSSAPGEAQFMAILREARIVEGLPAARQIGADGAPSRQMLLNQAMQTIFETDDQLYAQRLSEVTYLANVLIAGCSLQGRRFRPVEAAEAAVGVCQLGAEYLLDKPLWPAYAQYLPDVVGLVADRDMVRLFYPGWVILHDQVGQYTARFLLTFMQQLEKIAGQRTMQLEIGALIHSLEEKIQAAQPWLFLSELDDLLGYVDNDLVAQLHLLLNQYPCMPQPLRGREGLPDSPFIANRVQIEALHGYLGGFKAE